MATILPPPSKRQKREALERSKIQHDPAAAVTTETGSFKARFVDGDGNQLADVVEIPLADASEKNIALLLNTLLGRVNCALGPIHHLPLRSIAFCFLFFFFSSETRL
jgi:ribosome assembly protein 4